jgi:hypothetical protein
MVTVAELAEGARGAIEGPRAAAGPAASPELPAGFRPLLEGLESRLAPAVSAGLDGTTLNVTLSAMKDHAVLSYVKENASIRVVGYDANNNQTFSEEFTGVENINVHGRGGSSRPGPRTAFRRPRHVLRRPLGFSAFDKKARNAGAWLSPRLTGSR